MSAAMVVTMVVMMMIVMMSGVTLGLMTVVTPTVAMMPFLFLLLQAITGIMAFLELAGWQ